MLNTIAMTIILSASMTHHNPARDTNRVQMVRSQMVKQTFLIKRGVRDGSLTRSESRTLRLRQRRDRKTFRRYLRDRFFSVAEGRLMTRKLRRTSRLILRLRSNRRVRFSKAIYHAPPIRDARALRMRLEPRPVAATAAGLVGVIILAKLLASLTR
jgi:hypothetical protein